MSTVRTLRTFTAHYELESRQYELFGVDLGEGVRRRALLVGAVAVVVWVGLLAVLGAPLRPSTFAFWVTPPLVITHYATQPDRSGRRMRLAEWWDAARFWAVGRRAWVGLRRAAPVERPVLLRWTARPNTPRRVGRGVGWCGR